MVSPAAFLTPIMIARSFGTEVWRLTANEMFWTAGAIFGGIIVAWLGEFSNKIRILAISTISFGITFILLGLSTNFIFYLCVMFASGIFLSFSVQQRPCSSWKMLRNTCWAECIRLCRLS